jgi:hypothetical protein
MIVTKFFPVGRLRRLETVGGGAQASRRDAGACTARRFPALKDRSKLKRRYATSRLEACGPREAG